jgi:uncharacterized glyoxalase superfamily protein PhnB
MTEQTQDPRPVLYPFLRYADARAAVRWLCDAFGFQRQDVFDGPDGSVAHAELRLDGGVIMLGQSRDDALGLRTPRDTGAPTGGVYAYVADPDAHHERARAAGAEIVLPLAEMSYGSREYTCRDPEGNLWSFGTYRP